MNLTSSRNSLLVLASLAGLSLPACLTDDGLDADLDPAADTTAVAKGGVSGGGGGGGGGGTTTPDIGVVDRVSTGVYCDDGTVLALTLDKGDNKQIEVSIAVAQAAPTPAIGWLTVDLRDVDTGVSALSYASYPSGWIANLLRTTLGHQVTVGTHTYDFTAITHEGSSAAGAALTTCTAQITAVAR